MEFPTTITSPKGLFSCFSASTQPERHKPAGSTGLGKFLSALISPTAGSCDMSHTSLMIFLEPLAGQLPLLIYSKYKNAWAKNASLKYFLTREQVHFHPSYSTQPRDAISKDNNKNPPTRMKPAVIEALPQLPLGTGPSTHPPLIRLAE